MYDWSRKLKRNYEDAANRLTANGYTRRKVRGQTVKEIFIKDGHAFYLGRKLGSSRFQTYPIADGAQAARR